MAWKWFGVKTLVRWEAIGKPDHVDENYDEDATLLEERVVLIKARNFQEAIGKGEREVIEYLSEFSNFYGQKVKLRYLESCDAFELFEQPNRNGVELFSHLETVSRSDDDSEIIDRKMGNETPDSFVKNREKFWDAELLDKTENELTLRNK